MRATTFEGGKLKRMDKKHCKRLGLFVLVLFVLGLWTSTAAQEVIPASPPIVGPQDLGRPKTVGEVIQRSAKAQLEEPTDTVSASPLPAEQQLHFQEPKEKGEHWATDEDVGQSTFFDKLIRVCWSLALIALLVWVSAKIAGKAGLKQFGVSEGGSKSLIEIIERKRLSPGRSVLLMRVGPKILAVASTESGYETLTEIDGEEFRQYQDANGLLREREASETPPLGATTPVDIARHYLSIIPGTGAKK